MQQITEKDNIHEQWYKDAKTQTLDTLKEFIEGLLTNYGHDYGTICHAMAASGIAAMSAVNAAPQGGITGFQSGAVMWEFIRHWNYSQNKLGLKLMDYDKIIYPQYADAFQNQVTKEHWKTIQEHCTTRLQENENEKLLYAEKLKEYNKALEEFVVKYPDFYENREHYEHRISGTGEQHEEYQKKVRAGFEFAPREPYSPMVHPNVTKHWEDIVAGKLPFDFELID